MVVDAYPRTDADTGEARDRRPTLVVPTDLTCVSARRDDAPTLPGLLTSPVEARPGRS